MKSRIVLVAVVLAAPIALLGEHHDREEEATRARQELKALAQAVAAQSRQSASEFEATHHRLEQLSAVELRSPKPATPAPRLSAPDNEKQSERQNERQEVAPHPAAVAFTPQTMAEHLDSAFFQEGVEHSWADPARRLLQDKVAPLLTEGSSIRSLECQSTLCRLELVHGNQESYRQFQRRSFEQGPLWKGASFMSTEKGSREGESVTISYFVREGHPLPMPEADKP